ncbi:MAG: hypothetical protein ABJZ55_01265, partial [Fuerstiella sp.]
MNPVFVVVNRVFVLTVSATCLTAPVMSVATVPVVQTAVKRPGAASQHATAKCVKLAIAIAISLANAFVMVPAAKRPPAVAIVA